MSFFKKAPESSALVTFKVTRATPAKDSDIVVEIDGVQLIVAPGDFSKCLALGTPVLAKVA